MRMQMNLTKTFFLLTTSLSILTTAYAELKIDSKKTDDILTTDYSRDEEIILRVQSNNDISSYTIFHKKTKIAFLLFTKNREEFEVYPNMKIANKIASVTFHRKHGKLTDVYIIADKKLIEAFRLRKDLLLPYNDKDLEKKKKIALKML